MTHLRRAMLEELQRRSYATTTVQYYIQTVEQFAATLPQAGSVVFHDEADVSAFREAFGDLASEALRTRFSREWDARIENSPASSEATAKGGPIIAEYWIQRGRITRAGDRRPF